MSLQKLQCALAELFTSSEARDRYDTDRTAFCGVYDLNDRERAQLAALAESAIASYARALVRKRRAEASRLLPEIRTKLGDEFAPAFDTWAGRTPLGDGPDRYACDAASFTKYLRRNGKTR